MQSVLNNEPSCLSNGGLAFLFQRSKESMGKILRSGFIIMCLAGILFMPSMTKAVPIVMEGYNVELFASSLTLPSSLSFDNEGNMYVGVSGSEVGFFSIYKITPDGMASLFGNPIPDPDGVAVDSSGNVFVSGGGQITKIVPNGDSSLLASGFSNLNGIAIDDSDNIFVADLEAGLIYRVTQNGAVSILTSC